MIVYVAGIHNTRATPEYFRAQVINHPLFRTTIQTIVKSSKSAREDCIYEACHIGGLFKLTLPSQILVELGYSGGYLSILYGSLQLIQAKI